MLLEKPANNSLFLETIPANCSKGNLASADAILKSNKEPFAPAPTLLNVRYTSAVSSMYPMLRLNPAVILFSTGMFLVASTKAPDKPLTLAPAESVASANPFTALPAPPKEVDTFVAPVPVPVEPVRCTIASAN